MHRLTDRVKRAVTPARGEPHHSHKPTCSSLTVQPKYKYKVLMFSTEVETLTRCVCTSTDFIEGLGDGRCGRRRLLPRL